MSSVDVLAIYAGMDSIENLVTDSGRCESYDQSYAFIYLNNGEVIRVAAYRNEFVNRYEAGKNNMPVRVRRTRQNPVSGEVFHVPLDCSLRVGDVVLNKQQVPLTPDASNAVAIDRITVFV